MGPHDHSYKLLFSHPEMIRDLLEGFVREDWLVQLDYDSLQKVSSSYISDDLRERADDMVWRVRWGDGWVYVYLLLEFQSTVERYMAVRILSYVGLLYQDLIRTMQLPADGKLPPVVPIVLYNGERRWNAARELSELMQPCPRALETYRPYIRYVLIDRGQWDKTELSSVRNLVAALFRLESSRTHTEIEDVLRTLGHWLSGPEQASLRRSFAAWLRRVILPRQTTEPVSHTEDFQEMRSMLADTIREWQQEFKREGEQEIVLRQLLKRFGNLPDWAQARVRNAPMPQLEHWGERLLNANTLDAVFGEDELSARSV